MKITLEHISKRFQRHWIFREVNYVFDSPGAYALLGPNGCGKSTLLRIIAGMQGASAGKVICEHEGKRLEATGIFCHISFCAPGMEVVEELTLREFMEFHFSFKQPLPGLDIEQIIALIGLKDAVHKTIGDYSSGMKQRVKLAQAIFSDTPVLLLDEPCTNLDQSGVAQYQGWMEQYGKGRLVVVASNDEREFYFCKERVVIEDYK